VVEVVVGSTFVLWGVKAVWEGLKSLTPGPEEEVSLPLAVVNIVHGIVDLGIGGSLILDGLNRARGGKPMFPAIEGLLGGLFNFG
jgi:hypothetical protein